MTDKAVGFAFDQSRSAAFARSLNGFFSRLVDRHHILSVHFDARQAVRVRAACNTGVFGGAAKSHFRGVQIVLADVNHWQIPYCAKVHSFMEGTTVHSSIAEETDDHLAFLAQLG